MLRKHILAAIAAAGALGAGFIAPAQANAMPMVTARVDGVPLIKVRNGCGRGWHLNRWGRCVRNHHRYYPYRSYGLYGYAPYYYGWSRPYYRPWHRHHHYHGRHYYHRGR
jgi:hypothetical protein